MQIKVEALDLAETRFVFFSNVSQSFTEEVPRKIARIASLYVKAGNRGLV